MKTVFVILTAILMGNNLYADSNMKKNMKEINDEFTDKVKDVKEVNGDLEIQFKTHAAIYHVTKNNPKFKELQLVLEAKKKDYKKVKVVSSVPSMEIKEITE